MFMQFGWPFGGDAGDRPGLEVLRREPTNGRGFSTPLVFVHGAYVGAWCWGRHFLPFFAERGFTAIAPSLRGHGASEGVLQHAGIEDYVADLAAVVAELDEPPVLVGHSMGGLVIQRYLERRGARAVVLMASVPPSGLMMSSLRLMAGDPALFAQLGMMQTIGPGSVDVDIARRAVFSKSLPAAELEEYSRLMQPESHRALLEMSTTGLPRPWRVPDTPMLVLGAGEDALFSESEVEQTARAYGAECHIEPGMAHAMMLEPGWQAVAERLLGWLMANGVR